MDEQQLDRLVAAIRAQGFILQVLAGYALVSSPDPAAAAREFKGMFGDKFADAGPQESWLPPDRQATINHFSAHFVEEFWERVAKGLERRG